MSSFPDQNQLIHWILKDKYHNQRSVDDPEVMADIQRLKSGEPIAYIIGWVDFLNCKIDLSLKTLIPRTETEYWVLQLIQQLQINHSVDQKLRVLDLCCGSGCIGLAFLKNLPNCHVTFTDIDLNAVAQTKLNIVQNQIPTQRTTVLLRNVFEQVSGEFDLIASNPPYVLPLGVVGDETRFEPPHAIFAQKDGLELIEQILLNSKKRLKTNGILVLEFGMGQEDAVADFAKTAGFVSAKFRKDQFGVVRWAEFQ